VVVFWGWGNFFGFQLSYLTSLKNSVDPFCGQSAPGVVCGEDRCYGEMLFFLAAKTGLNSGAVSGRFAKKVGALCQQFPLFSLTHECANNVGAGYVINACVNHETRAALLTHFVFVRVMEGLEISVG